MSGEGPCHSGIGLVTLKLGLRPSFIFNDKLYLFLDLDVGRWGLRSSIGLVTLKLGLRPSFILNDKLCLFLDLDVGRWDLSLHYSTCHLEAGPSAQLHSY